MCAYVCVYFHKCVHVYTHMYVHMCACAFMHVYMCAYVYVCACVYCFHVCVRTCVHTVKVCICVPLTGGNCHSRESGGPCVNEVKHAEKGKPCTFLLRYGSRGSQAHRDDSGVRLWQLGSGRGDNSRRVCCFQQEE